MHPEGQNLEEKSGEDVIKENKEVTVECGSFTQEPFLLLPPPLTLTQPFVQTQLAEIKRHILDGL